MPCCIAIYDTSKTLSRRYWLQSSISGPKNGRFYKSALTAAGHKLILGVSRKAAVGTAAAEFEASPEDVKGASQCHQSCASDARIDRSSRSCFAQRRR